MLNTLKTIVKKVIDQYRTAEASYALSHYPHHDEEVLRIAFVAQDPKTWDKVQPLFEALMKRSDCFVRLYVTPSYDAHLRLSDEYGDEYEYFHHLYPSHCLKGINEGTTVDLNKEHYHYVFYTDPYTFHYPKKLRSFHTVRKSKICYTPYGYNLSELGFYLIENNRMFFRDVSFVFSDSDDTVQLLTKMFPKSSGNGTQHFVTLGYPALSGIEFKEHLNYHTVLWTPRWSYSENGGGSHFLEYKEQILGIRNISPDLNLIFRPHPQLFANMQEQKFMTAAEITAYKEQISGIGILDSNNNVNKTMETADILLTDFSGIIIQFFMTGKPIIYCPSNSIHPIPVLNRMLEGCYIAECWEDIQHYLKMLSEGNDPLKEKRTEILNNEEFTVHRNAVNNIIEYLYNDFRS